ncbi:hypothetical protein [Gemmatimonas sp.]|uniref:hypothetical protein n=1 Tax=Gemmatimonas sp. TaxID=1962908 RepID=UPI0022C33434|nr:hypothetical protein [Gemmatimonas sp.]MCZ8205348.1 hypothetical protein [Gemmatimonas sp.]
MRSRADTVVTRDPIARLQARLDAGAVTLTHDRVLGYLPALLRALDIPVSSQVLVFSRTSLQTDRIAPWSPRALYFNDDVYVGYVLESPFLEIGSVDPAKGGVFYTLPQEPRPRAAFQREATTCLMCHSSRSATGGVPGFMVLSSVADRHGYPITGVHEGSTSDVTPVAQRFGGYYVTGTGPHAGNVYAPLLGHEVHDKPAFRARFRLQFERADSNARTSLAGLFDTTAYLHGQSDVVALMVLTHQTVVHNLIMAVHEAAREAIVEAAIGAVRTDSLQAPVTPRLRGAVDNLTRALLFVKEARLTAPLRGTTSFAQDFARRGVRDRAGRSLRDFDLAQRLFRYPASFLIYSEAFDALPRMARRAVYARMADLLEGREPSDLTAAERQAVTEILRETKPEFVTLR